MLWLALAYALIEEGFTTQSLFNPNYAGQRLLDYGYLPSVGISLNWTVFVLTLHVVWSVGSAIAIAEALAGPASETPWLGPIGVTVTTAAFAIGCALTVWITRRTFPYVASPLQFGSVAIATAIAISFAFVRPRPRGPTLRPSPAFWQVAATSCGLSSAFHWLARHGERSDVPFVVTLTAMLALELLAVTLFWNWGSRAKWSARHVLAAAMGAVLTYGWIGTSRLVLTGATALGVRAQGSDVIGQVIEVLAVVGLIAVGYGRVQSGGRCPY